MRRSLDPAQLAAAQKKRTAATAVLIFVVFPLLILAGFLLLHDRSYMLISWAILLLTMMPFFMVFERRRPKARELVLIAMMTALTVAAQLLLGTVVGLRAGSAMVILSGVALGPEAGFLIGALSRFVTNFYAGQGPWTPWQMVCGGLLGFLAGLVFNRAALDERHSVHFRVVLGPLVSLAVAAAAAYLSYLLFPAGDGTFLGWRLYVFGAVGLLVGALIQRKRLPADTLTLTLFTFFSIFIVYGGLMNVCAMVTAAGIPGAGEISWDTLKVLYISGVPYDALHAGSAALFTFFFGNGVIGKLERVKIKYGLYRV